MDMLLEVAGVVIALPAAVAAACMLPTRGPARTERVRAVLGALALALGFGLAWTALEWAPLRPARAWHWLPYLALAAAAVSAIPRRARVATFCAQCAVSIAVADLVLPDHPGLVAEQGYWLVELTLGVLVPWALLADRAGRMPTRPLGLLLLIWAAGVAAILERCAVAKFAELAGVVASGLLVVVLLGRGGPVLRGAAGPLCVLLVGLLFTGRFETFASIPAVSFLLVLVTPVASLLSLVPHRHARWLPVIVGGALVAAGVGIAAYETL